MKFPDGGIKRELYWRGEDAAYEYFCKYKKAFYITPARSVFGLSFNDTMRGLDYGRFSVYPPLFPD